MVFQSTSEWEMGRIMCVFHQCDRGRGGKTQILEINVLKIQSIMCSNIDPLFEKNYLPSRLQKILSSLKSHIPLLSILVVLILLNGFFSSDFLALLKKVQTGLYSFMALNNWVYES